MIWDKIKKIIKNNYIVIIGIILIFGLILFKLFPNSFGSQFSENEVISKDKIVFNGLPEGYIPPDDWNLYEGNITSESVPAVEGYDFINATVDGVPVKFLESFLREDGSKFYYYRTDNESLKNEISIPGIHDNTKIILNYKLNEFAIDYKIKILDSNGKEITLSDNITNDIVFGTTRPSSTVNRSYSFDVRIPAGYTGEVYRYKGDNKNPENLTENRDYPLGTDPVFVYASNKQILADTKKGPKVIQMNDTFFDDNVREDHHIEVVLTKKAAPKFNASFWFNQEYAGNRGNTAKYPLENYDEFNYKPENGNWNWGSLANGPVDMYQDADGSYSYTWVIQTNTNNIGGGGYLLDSFELNGIGIKVPFIPIAVIGNLLEPKEIANGNSEEGKTYAITTLPDGAKVKVEYLRVLKGNNASNQRAYQITITGAHSDITVTGGNLAMYGGGAAEISIYSLIGVYGEDDNHSKLSLEVYKDSWYAKKMADIVIGDAIDYDGDPNKYNANIRFKLQEGYENPTYSLESTRNGVINNQSSNNNHKIYGPDTEGWYYIKIDNYNRTENIIALLKIEATPIRYVVEYTSDSNVHNPGNMPYFSGEGFIGNSLYDNNDGHYYDNITNKVISVSGNTPYDPKYQYSFSHWSVLDAKGNVVDNIIINPLETIDLKDLYKYRVYNEKLDIYVIRLQAVWNKESEIFNYDIYIRWTDRFLKQHETSLKQITTLNLVSKDEKISAYVNNESSEILDWLNNNPTYVFDLDKKQDYYEVRNGDTIYIDFIENYGSLVISNDIEKDNDDDNEFEFTIIGNDISDGTYEALLKNANEEFNEDNIINIIFENNEAKFLLKGDQSIKIYLPVGNYNIIEGDNKLEKLYDVKINEKIVEEPITSVSINVGKESQILFTNVLRIPKLDIVMKQIPNSKSQVKAGDLITYVISIKNTSNVAAHNIIVKDNIPKNMINTNIVDFSLGDASLEENIIVWKIDSMEVNRSASLTFTTQIPHNITEKNVWYNYAEIKYDNMSNDYDGLSNKVIVEFIPKTNIPSIDDKKPSTNDKTDQSTNNNNSVVEDATLSSNNIFQSIWLYLIIGIFIIVFIIIIIIVKNKRKKEN